MPPEEFYPKEYTDYSRKAVDAFMADFPEAILIGGWASWARIGSLPSHDIDVIVDADLLARIEERYGPVTASTHIDGKKWRADYQRVHLDIYVPYQSRLGGRLRLRVEELTEHGEIFGGWRLLALPAHLATKFAALLDRPESEPGEQDRLEIWRLLEQGTAEDVASVLRASEAAALEIVAAVGDTFSFLEDIAELTRAGRQRLRSLRSAFVEAVTRVFV